MSKKKKPGLPPRPAPRNPAPAVRPTVSAPAAAETVTLPELPEPRAELQPLPIWLIVVLFVMLYWGDMYVMEHGADIAGKAGPFPSLVYDPFTSYADLARANPVTPEQEEQNKGQQVFNFVCVQCHQANGQGLAGQFPPLAGSEWVQAENPERIIRIALNGITGPLSVKGQNFNNTMPPWKGALSDEQIAHVLTFVRRQWGNSASHVTPEEVKRVRDEIKSRDIPFTPAELQSLPEKTAAAK